MLPGREGCGTSARGWGASTFLAPDLSLVDRSGHSREGGCRYGVSSAWRLTALQLRLALSRPKALSAEPGTALKAIPSRFQPLMATTSIVMSAISSSVNCSRVRA